MIGTEKYYIQRLRAKAKHDQALEDLYKRAPGHMTMRAVTELEHKRDRNDDFRFTIAIFFLILSYMIEGPYWLDLTAAVLAASTSLYWIGMSFYTWKQTKARVLTVLENHEYLKDEAAAERY